MTGFRSSVAAAAVLAVAVAALAQNQPPPVATGAPTPLNSGQSTTTPPAGEPPAQPPDTAAEPPPGNAPTDFKPGMLSRKAQPSVTEGDLGIVDGGPVGTLDEAHGGLGQSMWVNAPRETVEDLLGRIPVVSADPFVRGLARRILLTPSEAPVGTSKRALVTIRIEKLLQAGLIEDAGTIAASLHLDNDPDFARVQAEALLYAGRDKDICGDLTATRLTSPDPFWLELRAWCFAASGDSASSELTRGVMDGEGLKDPAFDILVADIVDKKKTPPPAIDHPTALHIYLLRKAGFAVTNAIAAKLGTAANVLAVRDPRNKPAERLVAASRISATGALSSSETVALLNAQDISAAQIAQAGANRDKLPYLVVLSTSRRAATLETRPPVRATLLANAIVPFKDRWPQTALLLGDLTATLKPDLNAPASQYLFSRILVLSGRTDAAAGWYAGGPDSADREAFSVLADIAAPSAPRDNAARGALIWFANYAAPQKSPDPLSALALGLTEALGKPMPPQARALAGTLGAMRWPGRRPAEGDLRKLVEAASQPGRKGEVALRVLDIVGPNGPRDLAADVVIECVRMLRQVGLESDAKALAVEALALQMPPQ